MTLQNLEISHILFFIFVLRFIVSRAKLIFVNYWVGIRFKFVRKIGVLKYQSIDSVGTFLFSLLAIYSARYIYFSYFWIVLSVFGIIGSFVGMFFFKIYPNSYRRANRKNAKDKEKFDESHNKMREFILKGQYEETDEAHQKYLEKEKQKWKTIFIPILFILSWDKTFHFSTFSIPIVIENIISIISIVSLLLYVAIGTIIKLRKEENLKKSMKKVEQSSTTDA